MITLIIALLTGAVLFLILNKGKSWQEVFSKESRGKTTIVLLIALLTVVALFDPRVQGRINELRQKLRL